MIGIAERSVDHVRFDHVYVVGHHESVDRQLILSGMIRTVRVAAACNGVLLVDRRDQTDVESVKGPLGDRLRPGVFLVRFAEILRGIAEVGVFK